jgi:uncharacterized protein (DUF488 family)
MKQTIFTIGYSGFTLSDFIETLLDHQISALIDVRSQPYSAYHPEYNKEFLEHTLHEEKIAYRNYAREFGARQTDSRYYSPDGYLDFELFSKSEAFREGVSKLTEGMQAGYRFALMCAEKDPIICHRTIMVARAFYKAGYRVIHLLPGDATSTQEEIELRLLNKFFPGRNQESLFDGEASQAQCIECAYRKQNAEIGYSIEKEWQ